MLSRTRERTRCRVLPQGGGGGETLTRYPTTNRPGGYHNSGWLDRDVESSRPVCFRTSVSCSQHDLFRFRATSGFRRTSVSSLASDFEIRADDTEVVVEQVRCGMVVTWSLHLSQTPNPYLQNSTPFFRIWVEFHFHQCIFCTCSTRQPLPSTPARVVPGLRLRKPLRRTSARNHFH